MTHLRSWPCSLLIYGPQALLKPVAFCSIWVFCVGASARALDSTARCTAVITCNPDCCLAAPKVPTRTGLHSQPPWQLLFHASTHFSQVFVHAPGKAVSTHELHCCWLSASDAGAPPSMYLKQQQGSRVCILGFQGSKSHQKPGGPPDSTWKAVMLATCCWSARCMTSCMHWPVTPGAPCKLRCC